MSRTCFITCNQCFESNADIQQKFYVTNCYHVFCTGCLTNDRSTCNICKKKCKLLPIDRNLPTEVKAYFEPNSQHKLFQTIVKVHNFQQKQMKNYVERHYIHRKRYFELKHKMIEIIKYKKQTLESAKREKAIMDKLKDAYRTNVITPDLFQLRSQAASPHGLKMSEDIGYSSGNTMTTSTPTSAGSSVLRDRTNLGSHPKEFPQNLGLSNFNRGSQMHGSQRLRFSDQNDLVKDVRKGLIANTLRGMNQVSQNKPQKRAFM